MENGNDGRRAGAPERESKGKGKLKEPKEKENLFESRSKWTLAFVSRG